MKNNLLTISPEEIAKQYLQPQVSNLDGLTVYGGKRLNEPITIFVKGEDIKLDNYLYDWVNQYNNDYTSGFPLSIYQSSRRNDYKTSGIKKVLVNNISLSSLKTIEGITHIEEYSLTIPSNNNDTYCIQLYGSIIETDEESYLYFTDGVIGAGNSAFLLNYLPPHCIVILPKYLSMYLPKGRSNAEQLSFSSVSPSEYTDYSLNNLEEFFSSYSSKSEFIEELFSNNVELGEHMWEVGQYLKEHLPNNYNDLKPTVYITSDMLPNNINAYIFNNVKVKFLNSQVAGLAKSLQYWSDLDIEYNQNEYVKYLMNTYNNIDTITVFYNVTSTSSTHLNYIGTTGYSTPSESFTKMYIDGEESEIVTSYTFSTTGIHIVQYKCSSSYTELTPLFTGVDFYAIILPAQISKVCDFAFAPTNASESAFYIGLSDQLVLPSNSFSNRKITQFILQSNSIPGSMFTTHSAEGVIQSTTTIYVPASAVETYKTATGWSTYVDQIKAIPE